MKLTNRFGFVLTGVLGLATLGLVAGNARAEDKDEKEEKVSIDKVPAAVKTTLEKESGGTKMTEVDKESDDGKTVYEVDVKIGDVNYEIKVAEDGTLISKKVDKEEDEKADKKEKKDDKEDKEMK